MREAARPMWSARHNQRETIPVKEPIRKITLTDGTIRYRLVVDIGTDDSGKRRQITRTYDRQKDARAELSRIRHQKAEGTYVSHPRSR